MEIERLPFLGSLNSIESYFLKIILNDPSVTSITFDGSSAFFAVKLKVPLILVSVNSATLSSPATVSSKGANHDVVSTFPLASPEASVYVATTGIMPVSSITPIW